MRWAGEKPRQKCQNSQHAQKCFRRLLEVTWCLWAESPKRVSCAVQNLFRTGGNSLEQGLAPCKRPPQGPHPGRPKTLLAWSISTFGPFGCLDTCARPAGLFPRPQNLSFTLVPHDKCGLSFSLGIPAKVMATATAFSSLLKENPTIL